MTHRPYTDEADADGRAVGADHAPRRGVLGRMMWSRVLPGSFAVVAALTVPEFSVGAGDLAGGERFNDPPEPRPESGQRTVKRASATVNPSLVGVRYAEILDLDTRSAISLPPPRIVPSLASEGSFDQAFLTTTQPLDEAPALAVNAPSVPVEVGAASLPRADDALPPVAASLPAEQPDAALAAVPTPQPQTVAAADNTAAFVPPPAAPVAAPAGQSAPTASSGAAALLPEVQTALRSPAPAAAQAPAPVSAPAVAPAPAIAAVAPAPKPVSKPVTAPINSRSGMEQLTTAIVAPRTPAPAAAAPVQTPAASAPAARQMAAAVAPAPAPAPSRAPAAAPATLAKASAVSSGSSAPSATPRPLARPPAPTTAAAPPALPQPKPPAVAAAIPAARAPKPAPGLGAGDSFPLDIKSQLTTRIDGKAAGAVDFTHTSAGLKVRLGSIVDLLGDRYDPAQIARIRASSASNLYLSLAELQAQGIPISYDPVYDEFNVGKTDTRPKAARKVHMDQISAPERGIGSTGMDQVRR